MSLGRLYKVQESARAPVSALLFSGARIPRETLRSMTLADNVLREAEAAAAQLREQTAAILAAQKRHAHAQGFAQGHAHALASVLSTMEVERRLRELLSHRLADIVEHCMRSMLGEFGQSQLMRQRITHMLTTAGAGASTGAGGATPGSPDAQDAGLGGATLYVGPEQWALAQQIVAELSPLGLPGHIAGLSVVLDERRAPDALLLETKLCFIDSNMTLTLQEMRELVQLALSQATQALGGTPA
jgi:hypothetical protein